MLELIIFSIFNGFIWGLVIALVSLGLALALGLMDIVNIAHGDLYMMGAYIAWYLFMTIRDFWLGVLTAFFTVLIIGASIERFVLRGFEGDPASTAIITIALALIIEQTILILFGGAPKTIPEPLFYTVNFLGINYPFYRIIIGIISLLSLFGLWLLLYRTKLGLWIRASIDNKELAKAFGIDTNKVYIFTFALSSALAALGGALVAPIVQIQHLMGLDILALSFIIVIIGGLRSLKGVLLASLLIGILENIFSITFSPIESRVFTLLLMVLVLAIKPEGLFGGS